MNLCFILILLEKYRWFFFALYNDKNMPVLIEDLIVILNWNYKRYEKFCCIIFRIL